MSHRVALTALAVVAVVGLLGVGALASPRLTAEFNGHAPVGALEISIPTGFHHYEKTFGTMCRRACLSALSDNRMRGVDWKMSKLEEGKALPRSRVALFFYVWTSTSPRPLRTLRLPVSLAELGPAHTLSSGTSRSSVLYWPRPPDEGSTRSKSGSAATPPLPGGGPRCAQKYPRRHR